MCGAEYSRGAHSTQSTVPSSLGWPGESEKGDTGVQQHWAACRHTLARPRSQPIIPVPLLALAILKLYILMQS